MSASIVSMKDAKRLAHLQPQRTPAVPYFFFPWRKKRLALGQRRRKNTPAQITRVTGTRQMDQYDSPDYNPLISLRLIPFSMIEGKGVSSRDVEESDEGRNGLTWCKGCKA